MFEKQQLERVGARMTYLQLQSEMTALMTNYPGVENDDTIKAANGESVALSIGSNGNGNGHQVAPQGAAADAPVRRRVARRQPTKKQVGRPRKKRVISAAGRKNIALGQRKRWAAKKRQEAAEG